MPIKIRINFCDFWPGFDPENNFLLQHVPEFLSYEISEKPDYVFCSVYGRQHLEYSDCIKILYTGENVVPDFNLYDYAIGFHHITFRDRYVRFPLAFANPLVETLESSRPVGTDLADRRFCNFIYGNSSQCDPLREKFYLQLSEYRTVDSGGKVRNNIGRIIHYPEKAAFLRNYKFTIAFENSSVDGYITEKLVDAFLAHTVPIYFGSQSVTDDFHRDSYILVKGEQDFSNAIASIQQLDQSSEAYLDVLAKQPLYTGRTRVYNQQLEKFLGSIFDKSPQDARRRPRYGGILNYAKLNTPDAPMIQLNTKLLETYNRIRQSLRRRLNHNKIV